VTIRGNIVLLKKFDLSLLFGALSTSLFVFLYNFYFYDSFFPWTEGWFSAYGYEMNHGKKLYSDIYYFMPSLYPKIIAWFTSIFGYDILSLRVFGLFIITGFSLCLYLIFSQFVNSIASVVISVIITVYYQFGNAHITYDFIQLVNLAFLISYLAAVMSFNLDSKGKTTLRNISIFISGFLLSIAALIKHSNGGVVGLLTFLTITGFSIATIERKQINFWLSYVAGCSIPFLILLTDLLITKSLTAFIDEAIIGALSAKGGGKLIFTSWIKSLIALGFFGKIRDVFNLILLSGFVFFLIFPKLSNFKYSTILLWNSKWFKRVLYSLLLASVIYVFFLALYGTKPLPGWCINLYVHSYRHIDYAAVLCPVLFIIYSIRNPIITSKINGILLGLFSLYLIVGNGTSAGISEGGTFLALGQGLMLLLLIPSLFSSNLLLFIPMLALVAISIRGKKNIPYSWWNVTTPLNKTEVPYKGKILGGLKLNQEQVKIIHFTDSIINKYSQSEDDLFTFPHIPIFYLLNDKRIPTHSVVQWFDFLPDNLAIQEAKELEKKNIHVIIELDIGQEVWHAHERHFRAYTISGQRKIQEVINTLKKNNHMATQEIKLSDRAKFLISYY
jgi:hypothetical protein